MEKTYDVCTYHYPDSSGEQIDNCIQFQSLVPAKQYAVQLTLDKWKNQTNKEEIEQSLTWVKSKDMYGNISYLLQSSNYDIDTITITENKCMDMNIKDVYNTLNGAKYNIEEIVAEMDNSFQDILDTIDEIMPVDEKKYSALYDKVRKLQGDLTSLLEKNFPNIDL